MITIVKRDGRKEPLNIDKIHKVIEWACNGINGVSVSEIENASEIKFFNGMKSSDIHETMIKSAADLITEDTPNYQHVAGRLVSYHLRKEVYGQFQPSSLYDHYVKVRDLGYYDPSIGEAYSREEFDHFDSIVDHDNDHMIAYAGMELLRTKYLVKNRVTGKIFETPQMAFILIAMTIFANENREDRTKYVTDLYECLSNFDISLPTPIMAGVRTPQRQFSSCVLVETGDSLDSINATAAAIVKYVSQKAGIGIGAGRIRAVGSPIRNGDTSHTGVIPFFKHFQTAVKSCCLRPDTLVKVRRRRAIVSVPISSLKKNQLILTHENGKNIFKRVLDVWETTVPRIDQRHLVFENGQELHCSSNHPIMVLVGEDLVQKKPDELCFDDIIVTETGTTTLLQVSSDDQPETYVDITVDDTHTFFAASDENSDFVLTHNSQGGVRSGSATLNYPIWHYEVEDLLVLKNNKGVEENRIRHLDYCVQFNKVMYERLISGENITLFSPHDVPDLYEAFFNDVDLFRDLYQKYERSSKIRKKTIPASTLFSAFIQERKDTGRIYLMNVDHANDHGSFKKEIAPVTMTNLCVEVTLPTKPLDDIKDINGSIELCTLAAINLGKIKKPDDFKKPATILVRALDNILDYQSYPVIAAELTTKRRRPLGIGIINLAYWLAKNDTNYSSPNLDLVHEYGEAFSYYLIKASADLAKERGACELSHETKYHDGILPIDTYKKDVDNLAEPVYRYDWESLRSQLREHGIRNSTLMAFMPAENSAILSNATNGIEPPRALVSVKQSDSIVRQVVPGISKLRKKYELLWDQKSPIGYLSIMAVFQKFVDQSISTNTSYNPKFFPNEELSERELLQHILYCYKYGLKTLYYFNTLDHAGEVKVEEEPETEQEENGSQESCESCTI